MRRRVIWPHEILERLRRAPPNPKKNMRAATKQIDRHWRERVKRLEGSRELYSLKVGGWRVILRPLPEPGAYEVEHFGPREVVYEDCPRPGGR